MANGALIFAPFLLCVKPTLRWTLFMSGWATSIGVIIGTGGAVFYGTQKFFKAIEDHLAVETKHAITNWLLVTRLAPRMVSWPTTFSSLIDTLFGKNHWTWRCFLRSILCSGLVFLVPYLLIFVTLLAPNWVRGDLSTPELLEELFASELTAFLVIPVFNLIPDYFSLWKSRIFIGKLSQADKRMQRFAWLFADLVFSLGIAFIPIVIAMSVLAAAADFGNDLYPSLGDVLREVPEVVEESGWGLLLVNTPAATFASIWLWLYIAGRFMVTTTARLDLGFSWFARRFDIREKPLQCIGIASGALLATFYWLGCAAFFLVFGSELA